MPWVAAIGALGAAGIGAMGAAADRSQQQQQIQQQINAFQAMGVPPAQATQIVLQKYKNAGLMTPELEQTFQQGQTNLSSVAPNAQDRQAQMNALNTLQHLGENGGMLLSDKATLNNELNQVNAQNRGRQQAILANANNRGTLNSGASLVAQLENNQGSADRAQQAGLDINGLAQQRALDAIAKSGSLGAQMEGEQYNEQANAAKAQDAINAFNTQNKQATSNQNVALSNAAQERNLDNQQQLDNLNTNTENYQTQYNAEQLQRQYEDQLQQAAGETGQMGQMSNLYGQEAQGAADMWGGIGQGIAKAGAAQQQQDNFNNYLDRAYPRSSSGYSGYNPNPSYVAQQGTSPDEEDWSFGAMS